MIYTVPRDGISNSTLSIMTVSPPASYFRCIMEYTQNDATNNYESNWMECPSGITKKVLKSFNHFPQPVSNVIKKLANSENVTSDEFDKEIKDYIA